MIDIKAGDLVMVVRPTPCCGETYGMGRVFVVNGLARSTGLCNWCKQNLGARGLIAAEEVGNGVWQLSRLIRIDPPAQPEDVETPEELTA